MKGEDIFIEAMVAGARKKIENTLRGLSVSTDDVVFFYYSGRGFNAGGNDRWPSMKVEGASGGNLLKLSSVKDMLQSKKPRLLIVMADTANTFERDSSRGENLLPFNWVKNTFQNKNASFLIAMADNDTFLRKVGFGIGLGPAGFKELFLGYKGTIFASASIPGQLAFGSLQNGGFFTQQLLEAVESSNDANWETIMDKATLSIIVANGVIQKPQAKVEVTPLDERSEFGNHWDCPTW